MRRRRSRRVHLSAIKCTAIVHISNKFFLSYRFSWALLLMLLRWCTRYRVFLRIPLTTFYLVRVKDVRYIITYKYINVCVCVANPFVCVNMVLIFFIVCRLAIGFFCIIKFVCLFSSIARGGIVWTPSSHEIIIFLQSIYYTIWRQEIVILILLMLLLSFLYIYFENKYFNRSTFKRILHNDDCTHTLTQILWHF